MQAGVTTPTTQFTQRNVSSAMKCFPVLSKPLFLHEELPEIISATEKEEARDRSTAFPSSHIDLFDQGWVTNRRQNKDAADDNRQSPRLQVLLRVQPYLLVSRKNGDDLAISHC